MCRTLLVAVYAPQLLDKKKDVWDLLLRLMLNRDCECIIMGDFNVIRNESKRFGSVFDVMVAR